MHIVVPIVVGMLFAAALLLVFFMHIKNVQAIRAEIATVEARLDRLAQEVSLVVMRRRETAKPEDAQ